MFNRKSVSGLLENLNALLVREIRSLLISSVVGVCFALWLTSIDGAELATRHLVARDMCSTVLLVLLLYNFFGIGNDVRYNSSLMNPIKFGLSFASIFISSCVSSDKFLSFPNMMLIIQAGLASACGYLLLILWRYFSASPDSFGYKNYRNDPWWRRKVTDRSYKGDFALDVWLVDSGENEYGLLALTKDLLDVSLCEAGQIVFQPPSLLLSKTSFEHAEEYQNKFTVLGANIRIVRSSDQLKKV